MDRVMMALTQCGGKISIPSKYCARSVLCLRCNRILQFSSQERRYFAGFSEDRDKERPKDVALAVQKARHEVSRALRYVFLNKRAILAIP